MKEYNFESIIKAPEMGRGGAYVEFPYDVAEEFNVKGRVKVVCYFDGAEYRGSLVKMGLPCHIVGISKEIREKIGKTVGDKVKVRLFRDMEERTIEIHAMLTEEFDRDQSLRDAYEQLSYTKKKEIQNQLASAKKTETMMSRLAKIIADLK